MIFNFSRLIVDLIGNQKSLLGSDKQDTHQLRALTNTSNSNINLEFFYDFENFYWLSFRLCFGHFWSQNCYCPSVFQVSHQYPKVMKHDRTAYILSRQGLVWLWNRIRFFVNIHLRVVSIDEQILVFVNWHMLCILAFTPISESLEVIS